MINKRIFARIKCAIGLGHLLYLKGMYLGMTGNIPEAIKALQKAQSLYQEANDPLGECFILQALLEFLEHIPAPLRTSLVSRYHYLRRYLELEMLQRVVERVRMAIVLIDSEKLWRATRILFSAHRTLRKRYRQGEVITLVALSYLYEEQGHGLAQYYASEAAARLKEITNLERALFVPKIRMNPDFLNRITCPLRSVAEKLPSEFAWVVWLLLSILFVDEGQWETARSCCEEAIACVERTRVSKATDEARVEFMTKDKMLVYDFMLQLLLHQQAKHHITEKVAGFDFLPAFLTRQGRDQQTRQIFYYIERAKARATLDLIRYRESPSLTATKGNIRQLLLTPGVRAASEVIGSKGPPALRKQLSELITSLQPSGLSEAHKAKVQSVQDIQSVIPSDSILIEYYLSESQLIGIKITRDKCDFFHLGKSGVEALLENLSKFEEHMSGFIERLNGRIDQARQGVSQEEIRKKSGLEVAEAKAITSKLYNQLIRPLECDWDTTKKERLFVVPHGALHGLPFCALFNGENFLIEKVSVTQIPSASIWHHLLCSKPKQTRERETYFGIANPRGDEKRYSAWLQDPGLQQDIKGCEEVVKEAAKLFDPEFDGSNKYHSSSVCILSRAHATYALFKQLHGRFTVIDLETHAYHDRGLPMSSYFVLVGDKGEPQRVTADEILRDLQFHQEFQLLVLATCYGGEVKPTPGDDPLGLIRAFMAAGARSILTYRWPLIDEPAAVEFLKAFYKAWINNGQAVAPKDKALQKAQTAFINRGHLNNSTASYDLAWPTYDHPYYWAWTLIGDHF